MIISLNLLDKLLKILLFRWHGKISCQMTYWLSQPKNSDLRSWFADAFSQLLQLQFFQFAQVAEQFLVKSVTQPFTILKNWEVKY